MKSKRTLGSALLLAALLFNQFPAWAEVSTVTVARQYGIGYLALMIMEREKLIEKEAKAQGLPDLKVEWVTYGGGNVMNDALLSGKLHFAALGTSAFLTLWAKTAGTPQEMRAVCAFGSFPFYLNTRNPNVKSIKDFSEGDKIAVPAVKVSNQALMLQIAAEKELGPGRAHDLDKYTVSMAHPDAITAMLSPRSEINSHFTWDPFHSKEVAQPGVRTILDSSVVLGGPATTILIATQRSFRDANPKVNAAFLAAFKGATELINRDKAAAADIFLEISKDKTDRAAMVRMLSDPKGEFTIVPQRIMVYADFMKKIGLINRVPASWKDLVLPPLDAEKGS